MRQLVFLSPGKVEWQEAPEPVIAGAADAIVEPVAVAACDLDVAVLHGRLGLFQGPFPLGHEGVARVTEVGDAVRTVSPGDLVLIPFQISCGACPPCAAGRTGNCASVPLGSMYGLAPFGGPWGGFLADMVRVPYADAMLVRLGSAADPAAVASLSDNIPDAWRSVAPPLREAPGSEVLIVGGGGSISLYAIQVALALGAPRVHYADTSADSLALAERLGATVVEGPIPNRLGPYPITVNATGTAEGLGCALRSTAPDGICTSVGISVKDVPIPLFDMYVNVVTLRTGRVHARAVIPEVVGLVSDGRIHPELITTEVVGWDEAPAALADPPTKLVITRAS